ncbi:hypothetical protein ACNO65_23400 [Vibrio campbellii]|uniref:hypothetical protein n=1 Tax=Vibrio campbellii TaxID=680 RepID=UPI002499B610|nr:hypothetical protein [Vibrio campbellii]
MSLFRKTAIDAKVQRLHGSLVISHTRIELVSVAILVSAIICVIIMCFTIPLKNTVRFVGLIEPRSPILNMNSLYDGQIRRIFVSSGQKVNSGERLFEVALLDDNGRITSLHSVTSPQLGQFFYEDLYVGKTLHIGTSVGHLANYDRWVVKFHLEPSQTPLRSGDKLRVMVDAYPYQKYGFVETKVAKITSRTNAKNKWRTEVITDVLNLDGHPKISEQLLFNGMSVVITASNSNSTLWQRLTNSKGTL